MATVGVKGLKPFYCMLPSSRENHPVISKSWSSCVDVATRSVPVYSTTCCAHLAGWGDSDLTFFKGIYIAQLTQVSLRPGSNIKTKRFEFTPETVIRARRASGPEDCSKHVARRQRNSPNVLCVCVERHTICRWKSVAAVEDLRRPNVCRRRSMEVPGQTKTRRQNMLDCSQHVSYCVSKMHQLWNGI